MLKLFHHGPQSPTHLVQTHLVASKLDQAWLDTLAGRFNTFPAGFMPLMLKTVKALNDAGVEILVGTDASMPVGRILKDSLVGIFPACLSIRLWSPSRTQSFSETPYGCCI